MPILHWLTRDRDVKAADAVPYRLLERDAALSAGAPGSGNMLIQGDNLEALKSLLPNYRGQVKCIYIDPPYNTRSAVSVHYDDTLEHSQWLAMIYPRLELLQELLAEDGSIWVSIDDHEGHYLKIVMDADLSLQALFGKSVTRVKTERRSATFTSICSLIRHHLSASKRNATSCRLMRIRPRSIAILTTPKKQTRVSVGVGFR